MKTLLLFTLSIFLFNSCGSDNKTDFTAHYEKQLLAEYESLKNEPAVAIHLDAIEACKELAIADCQKDAFLDNKTASMNLVVGAGDASMFYFVGADKSEAKHKLNFLHEVKLKNVRQLVDKPFESRPSEFGTHTTGVMRLKETVAEMLDEVRRNMYIVVFKTTEKSMPKNTGGSFVPGVYKGRILIYVSKSKELIANIEVVGISSNEVVVNSADHASGLETDFTNRINDAYAATLNSKFTTYNIPTLSNWYSRSL